MTKLLLMWLAVAVGIIALPAGFVAAVDPFGYFGTNTAGYFHSSEREFKRSLARSADYNAIILGDSRIAYTDPSLIGLPQYRFLNGGIGASALRDHVALLQNARLGRLKLAVIALGHRSLSLDRNCREANEASLFDPIRYSAAWMQIRYAAITLRLKAAGAEPQYSVDGTRVVRQRREREAAATEKTDQYWRVANRDAEQLLTLAGEPTSGMVATDRCLRLIERVQALADRHGFRVVVVLLPINRDLLDRADWRQWITNEQSARSLAQLRAVAPNVVDFLDSPYSDSGNYWRFDSRHFKPEIGARLIEDAIRRNAGAR